MPRRRLSSDERKSRTLKRVTRVFAKKGFAGTSSAELARAAGVSEAMLYKLFGSKKKLYRAMIEDKLANAGWGEFPVGAEFESDRAFFTEMARAIFAKVEADPDFVRLLHYSDLQGGEFARMFHEVQGEAVLGAFHGYLRERIESGALRAVNPEVAGLAFLCMTWQWAVSSKVFANSGTPDVPEDQLIESLVSLFLKGVQA